MIYNGKSINKWMILGFPILGSPHMTVSNPENPRNTPAQRHDPGLSPFTDSASASSPYCTMFQSSHSFLLYIQGAAPSCKLVYRHKKNYRHIYHEP